jgi:PKD repeat protein
MKKLITVLLCTCFTLSGFAQMYEVPLSFRTSNSVAIIEGEVISQFSFWDDNGHNIYTANKVEVFKLLKGTSSHQYIEVITEGGTVGMDMQTVEPSLQFRIGDVGVFFLRPNAVPMSNVMFQTGYQARPYTGPQGFIQYDPINGKASDPFEQYTDPETEILGYIRTATNQKPTKLVKYDFSDEADASVAKGGTSISNFNPTTVTAGTETLLTINGSGFGASTGTVLFSNADDGGATFDAGLATEIISWNDAEIVVEVNQDAGTGPIQVIGTGTATSGSSLTVSYAELNAQFDPGSGMESYLTRHIDRNANGGYVWQMHTDFDASAANASFIRAMETWSCNSGIYWEVGATTTTDVIANDNINVVRFDNGSEMPTGTLGVCTSRWSGCGGATIEWYVEELDIVFDDGTNWNFTTSAPAFSQYDFESVAVHELGHGHQLGHVIDGSDVMHFSVSNGTFNHTPNFAGGNHVHSRSAGGSVCSQVAMSTFSCGTAPVADFSGTPLSICEGATVDFTDLSTNTPTGWNWTFTGGSPASSTAQNPTGIVFATAGTYTISLTATNAFGSDDEIKTNYITVNAAPNLTTTSQTGETCAGNDGTATVTPSGGSGTYSYLWDVAAANQTTATATGLAAGTYNVVVTDAVTSCSDNTSVAVNDDCVGVAPVADFSGSSVSICEGSSINFTDLSTNTPTGWTWTFTGGSPASSTAQNPTGISFATAGTYTITLAATNAFGSDDEIKTNYITVNALPNVSSTGQTGETCAGNDGTATVTPSGGSGSFNILWDVSAGSQTAPTATGLAAATYGVTVTDAVSSCQSATNVVVVDDCATSGTQVSTADCNTALTSIYQLFTCDPVAGATNYQWKFVSTVDGYMIEKYRNNGQTNMWSNAVGGILLGVTYDVQVRAHVSGSGWGTYGATCQITTVVGTIPTTQLAAAYCPYTASSATDVIYCDQVTSATDYEFQFTPAGGGTSVSVLRGTSIPNLPLGTRALGIQNGVTYDVEVRAISGNTAGTYGPTCQVTIPGSSATKVVTADCGATLTSVYQLFKCDYVPSSTNYQWKFVSTVDGTTIEKYRGNAQLNMWQLAVGGMVLAETYDVQVRALVGGVWQAYGATCQLTTAASFTGGGGSSIVAFNSTPPASGQGLRGLSVYPNPNEGQSAFVQIPEVPEGARAATVIVYDVHGKQVFAETFAHDGAFINRQLDFQQPLHSGVYIVAVVINDERTTTRMVVK